MTKVVMSRRRLLGAGACALTGAVSLPGAASAEAGTGLDAEKERVIRRWYAAWEQKEWGPVDALLADNFTFSSAAGDDHISKSTFKTQCWDTQVDFIGRFDLERREVGQLDEEEREIALVPFVAPVGDPGAGRRGYYRAVGHDGRPRGGHPRGAG